MDNPQFTGFYRVEYGLWHGQSAAELAGPASQLDHDVRALQAAFPHMQLVLSDLGLRTHEILENALQFQLTGHDDYGSGTTLATTPPTSRAPESCCSILHPLLVSALPGPAPVYTWLNRLQGLILAPAAPGRQLDSGEQLSVPQREQIDAAASQALQVLAPIAVITEPRS